MTWTPPPKVEDQRPVMREIIKHLGKGWTDKDTDNLEPDNDYARTHLIATNGTIEFWIAATFDGNNRKDPYKISSYYPQAADKTNHAHGLGMTINVGRNKSPAQVARDIKRRFLAEYEKHYIGVLKRIHDHELKQQRLRATEEMIAAALNAHLSPSQYRHHDPRTIELSPYGRIGNPPYGEAKLDCANYREATITIRNAPPELVIQIGRALQAAAAWYYAEREQEKA